MGTDSSTTSRELLDAVAALCSKCESGRLQIVAGSTKGALFFDHGKLVDARMGPFTGFPAVNLAISMRAASVGFDRSVLLSASVFNHAGERALLKERFGIETRGVALGGDTVKVKADKRFGIDAGEVAIGGDPVKVIADKRFGIDAGDIAIGGETVKVIADKRFGINAGDVAIGGDTVRVIADETIGDLANIPNPILTSQSRPSEAISFTPNTRKKVLVRTAAIVLIGISAAVGLASFWKPEPRAVPTSAGATPEVVQEVSPASEKVITAEDPANREVDPKDSRTAAQPDAGKETPVLNPKREFRPNEGQPSNAESVSEAKPEVNAPEDKQVTRTRTHAIAIVVEINDGHVTEAYIQNRQPGLGAFEATALRWARQRRYPKNTQRKETLVLNVTGEP